MIQTFNEKGGPDTGCQHLPLLRAKLQEQGVDGFLVPHEDEYQNEYLPECAERLAWISGFTGSAGFGVVLQDKALLLVDGRYTLQVRQQTDETLFDYGDLTDPQALENWLGVNFSQGGRLGYDPALHSVSALEILKSIAERRNFELVPMTPNPLDAAWSDRPQEPKTPLSPHPVSCAGESHENKCTRIGQLVEEQGATAFVVTSPDSLAWLLNIRGQDVPYTPGVLGRALLFASGRVEAFMPLEKVTQAVRDHCGARVSFYEPEVLSERLKALKGQAVSLDPGRASALILDHVQAAGAHLVWSDDPCFLPKACKNKTETEGARLAHRRDGAALTRFLYDLSHKALEEGWDEIEAVKRLEAHRHAVPEFKDLSFETISGAGPNGAVIHYRVTEATSRPLEKDSLFLVDSGAQYFDGTTDVTRTVALGTPSHAMRYHYTLVLKAHIALATVCFPEGVTGHQIDALARAPMWQAGLDYDHGTGHGVGSYLSVHEGPQRIAKAPNSIALQPGMIVSNEPGYYKPDHYGIRIENLQFVTEPKKPEGGERSMMGFETLTLAPLDPHLIDAALLTSEELAWTNAYHGRVLKEIGPLLDAEQKVWLEKVCAPL